jgi:starch phosphorylase
MIPPLPEELAPLAQLALDLRWTWSHAADHVWRTVDADAWERTRNPFFILQRATPERLEQLARDGKLLRELSALQAERHAYANRPQPRATDLDGATVAYFSMEFAIGEALPLYAGGLGVLAGDYLKTASDLGMPLVGVGLLFQEGYFRQVLDRSGRQREAYPYNDPTQLPIEPLSTRVSVELPGRTLWLRLWRARVGRVSLFLLDSNDPLNAPFDRGITSKLYGGDAEMRLQQEIVLGIGGWRALEALGIRVDVAHLNEGHAALLVLERIRSVQIAQRLTFTQALWATRAGNVFTTHTPVAAGFDRFAPALVEQYFPSDGEFGSALGIATAELLALGRVDASDRGEPFNMAYLALRGSAQANGVSALHGEVSRQLFAPLYPRWPLAEVPLTHVTNGVHMPSWDSAAADALWTVAAGKERWLDGEKALQPFEDAALWRMRTEGRQALVASARTRLQAQLARRGEDAVAIARAATVLDPDVLTLGFARRFAEYKRPTLLLRDRDRLLRLLYDPARPIQLVLAGKAHPADEPGKHMIEEWLSFVKRPEVRQRVVFLEDYDLELAAELVQGVDVWLNTPRRPMEACGTSGMKVLVNGALNCSSRDGWWAEAFTPDVGWALDGEDDARDADALYRLLADAVAPLFYDRGSDGIPRRWCARMSASMTQLGQRFGCNRMAADYVARMYRGAIARLRARGAEGARLACGLAAWQQALVAHWPHLRMGTVELRKVGDRLQAHVEVQLGEIDPAAVNVELFADGEAPIGLAPESRHAEHTSYRTVIATQRAAEDFSVRIVPRHEAAWVPAELSLITWSR